MLYYDRIGLLSPEFIAENGYRHYSLTQYLILEIIVNLRKLDIPISQIKDYLNHKSSDKFNELIHKKSCECDEIINKHIKIKHSLAFVDKLLSNIENLALNQITLEHQSEQIIFISDLSSVAVGKKRHVVDNHCQQNQSTDNWCENVHSISFLSATIYLSPNERR